MHTRRVFEDRFETGSFSGFIFISELKDSYHLPQRKRPLMEITCLSSSSQDHLTLLRIALFSSGENPSAHASEHTTTMSTSVIRTASAEQILREKLQATREAALQEELVRDGAVDPP